ncbi:MAG: D-glycero-beta-D-manno-heptose 1-phosphate adenylyltransferase [Bacteroidetes bacterium]|nr:MAG: D-glycero-beta-D-manno-heptose 1-phosphate adenylyltransferase [Bacteroidota bacterium]
MNKLETIQNKVFSPGKLKRQLAIWRFQDKKIVFTNGVFDLLHLGHIDYLSKAKDEGNILIVGVNTDDSTRRLNKGKNRPITNEQSRSTILAALLFVDAVVLFEEDTPYELIKQIQPDVLVKGSDYKAEDIVGYEIVSAKGGNIVTIDFLEGYSTTAIEEKIKGEKQ